ncbi:MAG: tryptophan 2,3-dioxygenase family protein [Thermodesulfobacteriota bacterium]
MGKPDANWWAFSIDGKARGKKLGNDPAAGTVEINPAVDGKRLLSYRKYLGLDRLLSAQAPGSNTPDERIFVVTHQLFEIVFKQAVFDFGVVAETFRALRSLPEKDFSALSEAAADGGDAEARDFWLPAMTASSRIAYSCRRVLPDVLTYLAAESTFDNREFQEKFRGNLVPASGFQSAQFRLIQKAFGKGNLLAVRLFPADTYLREYLGMTEEEIRRTTVESESAGLISVTDPLILQEDAHVASPGPESPLYRVTEVDDLAHKVLMKIADARGAGKEEESAACRMPLLPADPDSIDAMKATFREGLNGVLEKMKRKAGKPLDLTDVEQETIGRKAGVFARDWSAAVSRENGRRSAFRTACVGAKVLVERREKTRLGIVLDNLVEADTWLSEKFLAFHQDVVERRVGGVPGTAGGGVPFLDYSRSLVEKFPALAGYRAALPSTPTDR